jgi:hypothetical protein
MIEQGRVYAFDAQNHIVLTFSTAETRRVYAFEQIVEHDRTGSCVCV